MAKADCDTPETGPRHRIQFDFGLLEQQYELESKFYVEDHVSGALFAVLTSKAVSDHVIKALVASVANWRSERDIILQE